MQGASAAEHSSQAAADFLPCQIEARSASVRGTVQGACAAEHSSQAAAALALSNRSTERLSLRHCAGRLRGRAQPASRGSTLHAGRHGAHPHGRPRGGGHRWSRPALDDAPGRGAGGAPRRPRPQLCSEQQRRGARSAARRHSARCSHFSVLLEACALAALFCFGLCAGPSLSSLDLSPRGLVDPAFCDCCRLLSALPLLPFL